MRNLVLESWRLVGENGKALGILVGEVSGHPTLPDGWITTSPVRELSKDRSWADTESRHYVLGKPIPADQPLPPEASQAILSRLLRDAGTVRMNELDRLVMVAKLLSRPQCEVWAPADIREYKPLKNPGETDEEFAQAKRRDLD